MGHPITPAGAGHATVALALWVLPALVLTVPVNLLPFGVLLLLTSLPVMPALAAQWRELGRTRWAVLCSGPAVVLLAAVLVAGHRQGWAGLDTVSRLLVIPWVLVWVRYWQPPVQALSNGALTGLVAAAALVGWQTLVGIARPGGWVNPIVLADMAVVLLVLVIGLPVAQPRWRFLVGGGACVTILLLTGSRWAWVALPVALTASPTLRRWCRQQWPLCLLLCALVIGVVVSSAAVRDQLRAQELSSDLARLRTGDRDSSLGARLTLWEAALQTARQRPLSGVGPEDFVAVTGQIPACRQGNGGHVCGLEHAHNDLLHWLAVGGIGGGLAMVLVYAGPLWLFTRRRRQVLPSSPAWQVAGAGRTVVLVYLVCGLTQSMFSHQLTAGLYAVLTGMLLGLAWTGPDRPAADRAPATRA